MDQKIESPASQLEYGGVLWPRDVKYSVDQQGDITITLTDQFSVYEGRWEEGTSFKFDGDKLDFIESPGSFIFGQLPFNFGTKIEFEDFPPDHLHYLTIKKMIILDGLDLDIGCQLQFRNYVLYAAYCDTFGTVYFKRRIELPENRTK